MKDYQYIIIGGGMTSFAAIKGIRENDANGTIALFSEEPTIPYDRPPLTKSLWAGKNPKDILRPVEPYQVDVYLETKIEKVSPNENQIIDSNGRTFHYEKLLMATGGHPITFPEAPEGIIYYRTLEDFRQLESLTENKNHFCVIGGGFIGSEISAALNKQGKHVTLIFPEIGITGGILPDDLAEFLNQYYTEKGVNVLPGNLVQSIKKDSNQYEVEYKPVDGEKSITETFDAVIVGIGIRPNTELAKQAGIKTDDGILVNEFLQTNIPNIFAAGDVSRFHNIPLNQLQRVEHEDNANTMGKLVGKNMSGQMKRYEHSPFFYSDLFDLGYEAVGEINKNFEIYSDWITPFTKGTIFYLDNDKIRGLIFWNLWGKVDEGLEIIQEGKSYQKSDLKALFKED
jgi:NADPH-dependent 2,4-dienoyl-CoA reductase/sulfur reductase-like enzyme